MEGIGRFAAQSLEHNPNLLLLCTVGCAERILREP